MTAEGITESGNTEFRNNDVEAAPTRGGVPTELVEWRIAVRCNVCGAWLTDPRSVMAGIGPRCAQAGGGRRG
ncbi:DUF6011 domain-containing protein [Mycolicibacterium mengxianglii]|uniref:DUF6011 domain-containing protein n=1 Tax=Mycolicibacterium mengxianglii TaxID=2736649 RepID=UPI0018D0D47E|nr:DUF6011 domain-containing protein [Mycolicibacterium mengxianglii]